MASQCCTDREGRVIPPNKVNTDTSTLIANSCQGTTSQLGDSCKTEETTTCITMANTTGKMEVSYHSGACCLDR